MTNEVLQYRPFAMEDLSDIAHILAPLWHSDVPKEVQLLHAVIDFASYAQRATFSEVAVKDGQVIGFVLARAGKAPQETEAKWKQFLEDRIEEAKEQDAQSAAYLIAYDEAEERVNVPLLTNSSTDPNYELVFFAVGDAARGYGVGSKLLSSAQNYLSSEGGKTAFLFTDTTCTWEYYERRGMRRAAEWAKTDPEDILPEEMFIYEMDLD